MSANFSRRI